MHEGPELSVVDKLFILIGICELQPFQLLSLNNINTFINMGKVNLLTLIGSSLDGIGVPCEDGI